MRTRLSSTRYCLIAACLISCSVSGCSFGPNNPNVRNALDMLRIERDAAEDEYYALKQRNDEANWKIENLETQIDDLESQINDLLNKGGDGVEDVSYEQLEAIDSTDLNANNYPLRSAPPSVPSSSSMRSSTVRSSTVRSENSQLDDDQDTIIATDGVSEVSYIDIDPQLTRGFNSHGKSGDDGILVAIKPMDDAGRFIPIAAPVTISLIDPTAKNLEQRVGLWKFTSQQVASRIDYKKNAFLFRLPWQRNTPQSSDLKLFVRFQADDGKRESEMEMSVALDDQTRSRWTTIASNGDDSRSDDIGNDVNISPPRSTFDSGVDSTISRTESSGEASRIARPEWSPIR